jgi:hypothetical protein
MRGISFFLDTTNLDDKQKDYINLMRDQILAQKQIMSYEGMNYGRNGSTSGWVWRHG